MDGSVRSQKPDGEEICDSMERAKITSVGVVEWTETCYCSTALAHDRQTVYDRYFTDLNTEEIAEPREFEGQPFMEVLRPANVPS